MSEIHNDNSDKNKDFQIIIIPPKKDVKKLNKNASLPSFGMTSNKSSSSSNEIDIDKQDNFYTKKLLNATNSSFPIIRRNKSHNIISINKKLINDINYQINVTNKKIFGNYFAYKQTINLQEINDYVIYEDTKKMIQKNKINGIKNSVDFRIPLIYRRIANHYKKEDLIPMKNKPKINLNDVLIMHNSMFRKSMAENRCKNYYLKNNVKLLYKNLQKNKNKS